MIYAMSDIHGAYNKFMDMLQLIKFSAEDTLYVIGDICDRQEGGVKILKEMMKHPNIIGLAGNHEYMMLKCLKFLTQEITEDSLNDVDEDTMHGLIEWMNVGGEITISEFYKLSNEDKQDVIDYICDFDIAAEVEASGNKFVLVHAGITNFEEDRPLDDYDISELVFYRIEPTKEYYKDKYLVIGHTPTWLIRAIEAGETPNTFKRTKENGMIYKNGKNIAIDCGSGYGGQLGCICLDTLEEFYV